MLVLGIDPGTATTGFGLVRFDGRQIEAMEFGVLKTPAGQPLPERLMLLHEILGQLIARTRPACAAVEQLFFSRNVRTAMAVGHARGVVLLTCAEAGIAVAEYSPMVVKRAVGYGHGRKSQVQEMVRILLSLPAPPQPDDAADALAVAICHCHTAAAHEAVERSFVP